MARKEPAADVALRLTWRHAGMVFVADDLGAWLVFILAEAGRRKLTSLLLGDDQKRALRSAATVAVQRTAAELRSGDAEQAKRVAMVINQVFSELMPDASLGRQVTLLEALQAGIAGQLAVLDDASLTGTGQSSADVLGVSGTEVAAKLTGHLLQEVVARGSSGGPLEPLANQLNHDLTHLQGQRLEGIVTRLASEVGAALEQGSSTPELASRPMRMLPRPTFLAGREDLLIALERRLAGDGAQTPAVVALCGLAGAGKTSVAIEYAYRHLEDFGVVWQLAAEEPTALASGFGELAVQLGSHGRSNAGDPVSRVHGMLAARPGDWLLILDNAPSPAELQDILPPAGGGRVLITSQNPHWPDGQAMEVPVLDLEVAAGFLLSRTSSADRESAGELAVVLGGLPLALEQAGAYMVATGHDVAGYLALFQQRSVDLLARGEPIGYSKQVATAWTLAFDQLQQTAPHAVALLRLLSCCAPELIPLRLLLRPYPGLLDLLPADLALILDDPLVADEAIAALRRFSLISRPQDGLVSVHRLVQAVTLGQLPPEQAETWRQAARSLIEAALPSDPEQPGAWPACRALLTHGRAALPADSHSMARLARFLESSGSYMAARVLQEQIAAAHASLSGAEHATTLIARANLAVMTGKAGDPDAARDQLTQLLPAFEQVLGPDHPSTLTLRANLASWTGMAGSPAEARNQYATLLAARMRAASAIDTDTLIDRANLAFWTGEAGDPAGARDEYAKLVPVREKVSGAEHRETLTARANLARWTGEAGNPAEARDLYTALLITLERVYSPEHPSTLIARANQATNIGSAGDPAGARDEYAKLVPVREKALGAEHPETLTARANLARWTGEAGNPAEARDLYAALLPVRERVLGPEHPDTLTVRASLARWTGEAGNPAEARDLYAALLPVRERVLGPEHPNTLTVRASLARWTGEAGNPAKARDLYAALLPVRERVLGPEHPNTLTVRANLARWTGEAGNPAGARNLYVALLPVCVRVFGLEHRHTIAVGINLAAWASELDDKVRQAGMSANAPLERPETGP